MPHQHLWEFSSDRCVACHQTAFQIAQEEDITDWLVNIDPIEPRFPSLLDTPVQRMRMVPVIVPTDPDFAFDFNGYTADDIIEDDDDD